MKDETVLGPFPPLVDEDVARWLPFRCSGPPLPSRTACCSFRSLRKPDNLFRSLRTVSPLSFLALWVASDWVEYDCWISRYLVSRSPALAPCLGAAPEGASYSICICIFFLASILFRCTSVRPSPLPALSVGEVDDPPNPLSSELFLLLAYPYEVDVLALAVLALEGVG